jgi:glyoxylate/hydroxypyruvate reductase A
MSIPEGTRQAPRGVRVLVQTTSANGPAWRAALAGALPEADIALWPDAPPDPDYLVLWKPPPELFARAPNAKAAFNLGAGVDSLLKVPTLPPSLPVIRLEDAGMAEQMIEYVALAALTAYRRQPMYAAQQRARHWEQHLPLPKSDFAIGLLGLGVLGQAVAAALARQGFPLLGWSRERKPIPGVRTFAGLDALPAFLGETRMLVCLLPSTAQTRDLLDRARLSLLPRGAHLVNIARGELVVDADLLALLDEGHLASATLDVFREEPLPAGHPFWHHPGIVVTPHVSAVTLVGESSAQIAAKIRRLEQGLPVTGLVDRVRGY